MDNTVATSPAFSTFIRNINNVKTLRTTCEVLKVFVYIGDQYQDGILPALTSLAIYPKPNPMLIEVIRSVLKQRQRQALSLPVIDFDEHFVRKEDMSFLPLDDFHGLKVVWIEEATVRREYICGQV
ncbi:hypothetical protein D9613_003580 [Agrocybe pediades]|uniref:Uncharacterized protein n=1 Tax=Agrocybe pediades TaxID=84607 RepID=A0A8H4QJK8_9AGAR|nr:hypothetical protein D9613_003580 [Agrocybe pediades]